MKKKPFVVVNCGEVGEASRKSKVRVESENLAVEEIRSQ